jgi:hypothetical protein
LIPTGTNYFAKKPGYGSMSAAAPLPPFASLHDVRDKAILLSLGKTFLCSEVFLVRIGNTIDESIKQLREEILSLKMRFVGKFVEDVDTDRILKDLHSQAALLQHPDDRVIDQCMLGALGAELEETVKALTGAIKTIRGKVEGEVQEYTRKEAVVKGAKTAGGLVSSLASRIGKSVIVIFLLALGPAIYLGVTMEREGNLLKQIAASKDFIQSQSEQLASLREERDELAGRTESSQRANLSRQQKLEIMDLNIKVRGLDQRIQKAESEIRERENLVRLNQKKLEEIKAKTFLQRYLRQ